MRRVTVAVLALIVGVLAGGIGVGVAGRYMMMRPGDLFTYSQAREACLARVENTVHTLTCFDPKRRFGTQSIIAVRMQPRRLQVVLYRRGGAIRLLYQVPRNP